MTEWSWAIPVTRAAAIASVQVAAASVTGLSSVLPVSWQRNMAITSMGSAWLLRCLGADKKLAAWNLVRGLGVRRTLRQCVIARVGIVVTVAWRDIWHDVIRAIQPPSAVSHCQVFVFLALLPVAVANEQCYQGHHKGAQHCNANHCTQRVMDHRRGGHYGEGLLASHFAG